MGNNLKSIIIDDEKLAREIIKNYLKDTGNIEIISECSNGFEGIKSINDLKPDIVFLDIQMPKISGFEMLELLDDPPVIIFTTAFDQYALKAFEVNAADYLLKPFSKDRFNEAVKKAVHKVSDKEGNTENLQKIVNHINGREEYLERVVVKNNQKITVIPVNNLNFIEAQDDYVMLHTSGGNFLKQKTMKFFEARLDPNDFVRVHRSFILKLDQIHNISLLEKENYLVTLKDGEKLPVSKSGYSKLKKILE